MDLETYCLNNLRNLIQNERHHQLMEAMKKQTDSVEKLIKNQTESTEKLVQSIEQSIKELAKVLIANKQEIVK